MSRPRKYTEEEIAAEEERFGGRLPDGLRQRLLDGVPEFVVLTAEDGAITTFNVWGPSTTTTDKKGREYPTPGMTKETNDTFETAEELRPEEMVVAWGDDDSGDLAVLLRDGSLAWWRLHGGDLVPVEIDWDPDPELLEEL